MTAWSRVSNMRIWKGIGNILFPPHGVPSARSIPEPPTLDQPLIGPVHYVPMPPAKPPESEDPLQEVRLVRLQPGDVVVIRYKQFLSEAAAAFLRDAMRGVFSKNKVVILEEGAEIDILSPEEMPT